MPSSKTRSKPASNGVFRRKHFMAAEMECLEARRMLTGTWSTLTNAFPTGAQMGVVMTDGSIMVHGGGGNYTTGQGYFYKLTPSSTGNYSAGTISSLATEPTARLYTATEVLQNGDMLNLGGEYFNSTGSFSRTGDLYNPATNTWSSMTNYPQSSGFGDDPTALLPNGSMLAGYYDSALTYIYNPTANTWTLTGSKLNSDASDEEGWVTLPDHSILSYSVFASISTGTPQAQRYIPSTGTWVSAGTLPAQLSSSTVGYELGPGLLLPDGRVFYAGATAASAYYTPSTNSWAAGPTFSVNGTSYVAADAPGAVLPNGDVLLAMSPLGGISSDQYTFPSPTAIFELNPTTNVYTNVPLGSLTNFFGGPSFEYTFLVLPTGQVAVMGDSTTVAVYTESGTPVASASPVITGINFNGTTGVYTLSGTNLNGINEGAAYGDDNEMSSNYPLVRLTSALGVVTYAKTTNWSQTGVDIGAETVSFTLPTTDTAGAYLIQAVANGVPSATALAVFANAGTGITSATVQTDANPSNVDVLAGSANMGIFPTSAFSTIYVVGDNSGDNLNVRLSNNAGIPTYVQAGSGTDTININQTASTSPAIILPSTGSDAVNVGTASDGVAVAQFLTSQQIGLLTIGSGGLGQLPSEATRTVLQTSGIVTSGTGALDLENNDAIVHFGQVSVLNAELASGYHQGAWNGSGIESSTAAADITHHTALGILLNSNSLGTAIYNSFEGVSPTVNTDVLIKYTYYGDADLNGQVNGSDYSRIDAAYQADLSNPTADAGWSYGDFNYDGFINGSDYTLIDNVFNSQAGTITAQVAAQIATPAASVGSPAVKPGNQQPRRPTVPTTVFANAAAVAFPLFSNAAIEELKHKKELLDGSI